MCYHRITMPRRSQPILTHAGADAGRGRHWARAWVMLTLGCLACAFGSGCGRRSANGPEKFFDTRGVPLSRELRAPFAAGRAALSAPQPRGKWARDLDLYHDLALHIQRVDARRAAGDTLYARWHAEPAHFLWIELAARYNSLLRRNAERNAMYALPALADTLTPVGAFVHDRRFYGYGSRGAGYRWAAAYGDGLDSLQQVWLALKLAMVESDGGDNLGAVRRLLAALPRARAVAGCRLEGLLWGDIATILAREDRLDDALHAAALAGAMAAQAGYPQVAEQNRLTLATILEARREADAALSVLDACIATAVAADYPSLYTASVDHAASLCSARGDRTRSLLYDQRNLARARANRDSLNVPRIQMNVADDFRKLGQLDSCLAYQRQAQSWVAAFPNGRNRAFLPAKMAPYYCQIGDYARADSLLDAAHALAPGASTPLEEAGILTELLTEALEAGHAELAYRVIARLQVLRGALQNTRPDQNRVASFEIASADFLTRQGEFRLAQEALARAAAALRARTSEDLEWEYCRAAGELGVLRDDLASARANFTQGLAVAEHNRDPDLVARSRFQLGHVLLAEGRWPEARALFTATRADSSFGGRFRTRLSSQVLLGTAWLGEGRAREALRELTRAEALCTDRTPGDLVAQLYIETGRAHAALGDAAAAERALRHALDLLRDARGRTQVEELRSLGDDAVRDATEALLTLWTARGSAAGNRGREWETFWLAEAARRGPWAAPANARAALERQLVASTGAAGPTLAFFVGRTQSFAWIIDGRTIVWRALPGRGEIAALLTPVIADMTQPERAVDENAARTLATLLLGDLGARWRTGTTLRILTDDLLASVPWAALPFGTESSGTMLDRGPVVEAPDVAACVSRCVAAGANAGPGLPPRLLALGCNDARPADEAATALPALRYAEAEAREVAAQWPVSRAVLRLGAAASWDRIPADSLAAFGVIHIATHAVAYQGLASRATIRLGDDGAGLPLTMQGVRALRLGAGLVYLSCCEAAMKMGGRGVTDFAQAFLAAGTGAVVASTVRVDDAAARTMAGRFYRAWLAGEDAPAALQQAQRAVRDADARWRHPYYWAFYKLIGCRAATTSDAQRGPADHAARR